MCDRVHSPLLGITTFPTVASVSHLATTLSGKTLLTQYSRKARKKTQAYENTHHTGSTIQYTHHITSPTVM